MRRVYFKGNLGAGERVGPGQSLLMELGHMGTQGTQGPLSHCSLHFYQYLTFSIIKVKIKGLWGRVAMNEGRREKTEEV